MDTNLFIATPSRESLFPMTYGEASFGFEMNVAEIRISDREIYYSIFYGQPSNSIILDLDGTLQSEIRDEVMSALRRHFAVFNIS